jgi:pantoate--beta-alanine ligase
MLECRTVDEVRVWRRDVMGSIGLVPTMGALHEGHLSLVRRARQENDFVATSIFVNPRQFGDTDDFSRYPRTVARDLELLRIEGVDAVFLPEAAEMYSGRAATTVLVDRLSDRLEGSSRPEHFQGVCTVVCKLFNIVQPDRAYFGQKDAQQVIIIRKMVEDLNLPVEIVAGETVRDHDGLALSSRNVHLSERERAAALAIPRALFAARDRFQAGERSARRLREIVLQRLEQERLLEVDYVSVADSIDLEELECVDLPAVLSIAVSCGATRLIDNVVLDA